MTVNEECFGFGTVGWTKGVIQTCRFGLWEIVIIIFHNFDIL